MAKKTFLELFGMFHVDIIIHCDIFPLVAEEIVNCLSVTLRKVVLEMKFTYPRNSVSMNTLYSNIFRRKIF